MEAGSGAAEVLDRRPWRGPPDRRSRRWKVHRRPHVGGGVESESVQTRLPALVFGHATRPAPSDRARPGSGALVYRRRPDGANLGGHRAPAQNPQATPGHRYRRGAAAGSSRTGNPALAIELRTGFRPLSDPAAGGPAAVAPRTVASDA